MTERPEVRGELSNNLEREATVAVQLSASDFQHVVDAVSCFERVIGDQYDEYDPEHNLEGMEGLKELAERKAALETLLEKLLQMRR